MLKNRLTAADIDEIMSQGDAAIREYISLQDRAVCNLETLLELIPPCPAHGSHCVPHAREWVQRQLAAAPPPRRVSQRRRRPPMIANQAGTVWQVDARPGQVRLMLEALEEGGGTFWVSQVFRVDEARRLAASLLLACDRAYKLEEADHD